MTAMKLTEDHKDFLNSFLLNFSSKYPKRYVEGVNKYQSTIHKDYTVEEHIANLEEELFDALAYLHAIRLIYRSEHE